MSRRIAGARARPCGTPGWMSKPAAAQEPVGSEPCLVVDLDGTLIRTDPLVESILVLLKARPWLVFFLPLWLLGGRARLEAELARRAVVPADGMVYNPDLLERLRAEHARGRAIVLATASHRDHAERVAAHLGLFAAVLASDEARDLEGAARLEAILAHTGGAPFDYAGNAAVDLPIWRRARRVVCVETPAGVVRQVRQFAEPEVVGRPPAWTAARLARALRVHQWLKNVLVFVPVLAAHRLGEASAAVHAALAFVAFSLCASSVYVLNDLSDLRADRLHPRKRRRPFAAGDVPLVHGMLLGPVLLATAFTLAALVLPGRFVAVLATYYLCSLAYNFVVKERAVWDVMLLAVLYTLRVIAGAAAIPVPASFWLLAFSIFIFLSLALAKRYSEMVTMVKAGRSQAAGRGYFTDDMPVLQSMGVAAGYLAVLVIALYINSAEVHALYRRPELLWGVCPLLLFWITRVWLKTHRGEMHDDPVVYAVRDPTSLVIGALTAACLVAGTGALG